MNEDIIKGRWNEVKGKIKQKWGEFTDDEVTQIDGKYDQLEGTLQKKYGYQKDVAKKHIDDFITENKWRDEDDKI